MPPPIRQIVTIVIPTSGAIQIHGFTDGDFLIDAEQMSRFDVALGEFRRRGLAIYPVGIGSRTGVNVDSVLTDYIRGVDYDETLEADLEGQRTRLGLDGIAMLEQRTGGRSFIVDSPWAPPRW